MLRRTYEKGELISVTYDEVSKNYIMLGRFEDLSFVMLFFYNEIDDDDDFSHYYVSYTETAIGYGVELTSCYARKNGELLLVGIWNRKPVVIFAKIDDLELNLGDRVTSDLPELPKTEIASFLPQLQ